jgi:trigger factor
VLVKVERLSPSEARLTVEVEPERVERALDGAYRRLAGRYNVPGFRRGKVPRPVLERLLGADALADEALDPLMTETFEEALAQEGLDPLARAEIEGAPKIVRGQPFTYVAKVPVRPEVRVPDVRSLTVNVPRPEVTDADVDQMIRRMAESRGQLTEGTQVEPDGVVVAAVSTEVGGEEQEGGGDATIDLGRPDVLPGAREALEGAEVGETRQVVWNLPADHPSHPGAEAVTRFEVKKVLRREVPPVDDALARAVGAASLDELRASVRRGMERELAERWRAARLDAAVAALVAGTELAVPDVLVDEHLESHWQEFLARLRRAKLSLPAYLAMAGKDEDTVRREMRPDAVEDTRRNLVLEGLAIAEGLEPAEGEIRLAAEQLLPRRRSKDGSRLSAGERRYVRDVLRRTKARRLLESLYARPPGEAEDETEDGAGVSAAASE